MKLLLTLLTIIPLTIFSQDADSTKTRKFAIGLSFSPDYCYRTLKSDASSKWIADTFDSLDVPKFGYTTGVKFSYQLNKKISFDAGLLFSDKGEKTKTPPGSPTKRFFIYHYYYIDLPVKFNYYIFSTDKGVFYTSASLSTNIFLAQKTNMSTTSGYNTLNLAFTVGLGYQVNFSNKLFLKIEPTFRRSISSVSHGSIKGYLYSTGLDIGFYYKI